MDAVKEKYQKQVARQIITELGKKRMAGSFAPTINQAKEEVIKMIPEGSTVYRCGSTSLVEIGLWEAVKDPPEGYGHRPLPARIVPGRRTGAAP